MARVSVDPPPSPQKSHSEKDATTHVIDDLHSRSIIFSEKMMDLLGAIID